MSARRLVVHCVFAICSIAPTEAAAQAGASGAVRVEVGVEPEQVTVGEPFRSALRVVAPDGYRVEYGDLPVGDSLQATEPVTLVDSTATGATAVYTLVAWVAGAPLEAAVPVRLIGENGVARAQSIRLRLPTVASVLPAETEEIVPKPAHGLITPPLFDGLPWWWWLLLLIGALIAALVGYMMLRRRNREDSELAIDPREWALSQLSPSRLQPLIAAGEIGEVYRRASWVLRRYLCRLDPDLGLDLTTTELFEGLARRAADREPETGESIPQVMIAQLAAIIDSADRVKFARYRASVEEASAMLDSARAWVATVPPPSEDDREPRRAA